MGIMSRAQQSDLSVLRTTDQSKVAATEKTSREGEVKGPARHALNEWYATRGVRGGGAGPSAKTVLKPCVSGKVEKVSRDRAAA